MSEMEPQPTQSRKTDGWLDPGRTNIQVIYILYLVGFVIGISALVGVVMGEDTAKVRDQRMAELMQYYATRN